MTIRTSLSAVLVLAATVAIAAEPTSKKAPKKLALDVGKGRVERPTKELFLQFVPGARLKSKEERTKVRFPVTKAIIEAPTKALVKTSAPAKPARVAPLDRTKRVVELSTKRVVEAAKPVRANPQAAKSDNPRVSPGKVHWASDYAAALAASKKSGKPVLLFQLLGQLDHKFT